MPAATPLAPNVATLLMGTQPDKGTLADPRKRFQRVSGSVETNQATQTVSYADGQVFGPSRRLVTKIDSSGSAVVPGTVEAIGYLFANFAGNDTVSSAGSQFKHTSEFLNDLPTYITVWESLGDALLQLADRHADCQITQLVLEGAVGTPVVQVTAQIRSLDPQNGDPAVGDEDEPSTTEAFLFTDTKGTLTISQVNNGAALVQKVSQWRLTVNRNTGDFQADDVRSAAFIPGRGDVTFEGTILVDSDTLPAYYKSVYGTTTPAAGAKPTNTLLQASVSWSLDDGTNKAEFSIPLGTFTCSVPRTPVPEGGRPVEMSVKVEGDLQTPSTPMLTVATTGPDADEYDLPLPVAP